MGVAARASAPGNGSVVRPVGDDRAVLEIAEVEDVSPE